MDIGWHLILAVFEQSWYSVCSCNIPFLIVAFGTKNPAIHASSHYPKVQQMQWIWGWEWCNHINIELLKHRFFLVVFWVRSSSEHIICPSITVSLREADSMENIAVLSQNSALLAATFMIEIYNAYFNKIKTTNYTSTKTILNYLNLPFISDRAGVSHITNPNFNLICCEFIIIPFSRTNLSSVIKGVKNSFNTGLDSPHQIPMGKGWIFEYSVENKSFTIWNLVVLDDYNLYT